jgi:hypothetical protein
MKKVKWGLSKSTMILFYVPFSLGFIYMFLKAGFVDGMDSVVKFADWLEE